MMTYVQEMRDMMALMMENWMEFERDWQYDTVQYDNVTLVDVAFKRKCVLGRDGRSTVHTAPLSSPKSVTTNDGLTWTYQDLGTMHYDQCQLRASEAGAVILAPSTLDDDSNSGRYWIFHQGHCSYYQDTSAPWTELATERHRTRERSAEQHGCHS